MSVIKCALLGAKALLDAVLQLPQKARSMEHKLSAVLVKFRKEEHGAVANRVFVDPPTTDETATTTQ